MPATAEFGLNDPVVESFGENDPKVDQSFGLNDPPAPKVSWGLSDPAAPTPREKVRAALVDQLTQAKEAGRQADITLGAINSAEYLTKAATSPIVSIPRTTGAEIRQAYPTLPGPVADIVAGAQQGVAGVAESVETPLNLAAMGAGAIAPTIGRVVAGVFAAKTAQSLPEQARQLGTALGEGNLDQATAAAISTVASGAVLAPLARHAIYGTGPTPAETIPAVERTAAPLTAEAVRELPPVIAEIKGPEAAPATPAEVPAVPQKNQSEMTFDELRDFLSAKVITHDGAYELQNLYESKVGESAPTNSSELVDALLEHYDKYPADLKSDFQPSAAPLTNPENLAGPGGTVPTDVGAAKSELNQLADSLPAAASSGKGTRSSAIPDVTGAIKAGLSKVQDAFHAAVDFLKGPPEFTDMQRAIGVWSRMRQESARDVYFAWKKVQQSMPDTAQRDAIGAYVDAGGDRALMEKAAAELPKRYAANYERALKLTPDEIKVAENTRNYFDKRLQDAQDAGILEHGVENYIRRIFEKDSAWKDAKLAELRFLSTGKPGFARQRVFETDTESIKAGYKPVQDFAQRVATYDQELNCAIADRKFVKSLMARTMLDGRPMIDVAGTGTKIEGDTGTEAILIKPQFKPADIETPENNRTDYRDFNHPAFRKWKWVVDQEGVPVMVQGDVLVHPGAYKQMQRLLERSSVKAHAIGGPLLKISSGLKQTMLDLSGFHQVQIAVHALEHRVVPSETIGNLIPIDLKNPIHQGLVEHGLTIFEESGFTDFSEGLHGNSLISKIPGIGPLADAYHNWLFKEFIPTVKMTMAVHALERNRATYPKLSEDQLLKITAEQSNAAFGGQNWKMLGHSETGVDLLRLAFLAPDFLVSRAKFVGQAGKPLGREQLTALFLGAAALYATARVANQVIGGNPHWEKENAFSVINGNHAYGLRTVQGDILHLLEAPGTFWYHRVNPLTVQPLIELLTGRNYFGAKVTPADVALDTLKKPIPISLAGLVGGKDQTLLESALNAFGVQTKRFSAATLAYQMAADWKEKNKIKGDPGEFIYDPKKDPLHPLKSALQYQDTAKAGEEIGKLIDSGQYSMAKLNSYFARYRNAPFTGSRANDSKFIASLNEGDRKTIEEAKSQRQKMFQDFQAAKSLVPKK